MKTMRILLAAAMAAATCAAERVNVCANSFDAGGWSLDCQFMDVMGSPYLLAHGIGHRVCDAKATARIPSAGAWDVWARTRRWVDGAGAFAIAVDGRRLAHVFGRAGSEWHWEKAGTLELAAGEHALALQDLDGFDGRCAGVVFASAGSPAPTGALSIENEPPAETVDADFVVVGGGIPGTCAAVAAARSGVKTVLVQDRPVLGGNASSEIRVWCAGELRNDIVKEIRGRFMNMEQDAEIADRWRQRIVDDETNLACRLSTRAFGVEKNADGSIAAVKAVDLRRNRVVRFRAPLFLDATGDGWVGFWAGADWRMGREGRAEHDEPMAPEKGDRDTLGASLMWTSRRASVDEPFSAPWAEPWAQGVEAVNGEWNWEYGIHRDVIAEGEAVRDRLLLAIYGAFSRAKKRPEHARRVLNFVPFLIGKRESRRLLGDWILSERDVTEKRIFDDAVSAGSWSVDLHYDDAKPGVDFLTTCRQPHFGRYWIPFRALYSRNVPNLMMAGRCFSCTHVGLGSPRVINTLALMGVACGYAAADCKSLGIRPREVYKRGLVRGIQRKMGGDWPGNPDPARAAWRIVDDETPGVAFGKGWHSTFNSSGNQEGDKSHACWKANEETGNAVYPLPVPSAGKWTLWRKLPFRAWDSVEGRAALEIVAADGKTVSLSVPALENAGEWTKLGEFDLAPGATLRIVGAKSSGRVFADAFAVAPVE